ncbi:MAG: AI-2E family transporter [Dehalococcoidia bacterium]|nr:AI-2E family transporter [Dehalococcoidia bacterium]
MEIRRFFDRNWRYLLFAVLTAGILGVLYVWRNTLLPFLLGVLLAYLLSPLVNFLVRVLPWRQRWPRARRSFVVLLLMFLVLCLVASFIFFFVSALVQTFSDMVSNISQIIDNIVSTIRDWTYGLRESLPGEVSDRIDAFIDGLAGEIASGITSFFSSGSALFSTLSNSIGFIFSFAVMPLFLYYVLMDYDAILKKIYTSIPSGVARHFQSVMGILDRTLGRYMRGQLYLGTIVGIMSLVGLLVLDMPYALPLAVLAGLCEMIPTFGPIISGAVMVLIALALVPDKVFLVLGLAVGVQLLENNLIVPRVMSASLRMHPIVMLMMLVMGGMLWGFWGLLLAAPILATLVDIFRYVRTVNNEAQCVSTASSSSTALPPGE